MKRILYWGLVFLLSGCASQNADLKHNAEKTTKGELLVFVGEKINIFDASNLGERRQMDRAFAAVYKIKQKIYGDFEEDEIVFRVYDHYGVPAFSKYQHALLYVVKKGDILYHVKYQYSPLFKTQDGKWAGPYAVYDYNHKLNKDTEIKPVKINFADDLEFDISNRDDQTIKKWYPEPFYKIDNNKAIAVYGNYVEELFQLKKEGELKLLGHFN